MKKVFLILCLSSLFLFLSGCKKLQIEKYTWIMQSIKSNSSNDYIACSLDNEILKEIYPEIMEIDMTCEAKNGNIIITDKTNNHIYEGTYEKIEKDSNESRIIYKIFLDGKEGTISVYELSGGMGMTAVPTKPSIVDYFNKEIFLTININDYTLYFELN